MIRSVIKIPQLRLRDASLTNIQRIDKAWINIQNATRKHDFETAIAELHFILSLDRRNATAYNRLGIVYAKMGELRRATHCFKRSLKYDNTPASKHNLGLIYYERKLYQKSLGFFEAALTEQPDFIERHITVAKVYEHLGNQTKVIENLKVALKHIDSKTLKTQYLKALRNQNSGNISKEILDALAHNKLHWGYESLENYERLLANVRSLHGSIEKLLESLEKKKLSNYSKHSRELGIIFLHHSSACVNLLEKNYSHATINLARSLFEIYLKLSYAASFSTYRGYAEFELRSLVEKKRADERLIAKLDKSDPLKISLSNECKELNDKIKKLKSRYKDLTVNPSMREIALKLDDGKFEKNYILYTIFYQRGSESSHVESEVIRRAINLSGTNHAGLFNDSYNLVIKINELMILFGHNIAAMPEITKTARKAYIRTTKNITFPPNQHTT